MNRLNWRVEGSHDYCGTDADGYERAQVQKDACHDVYYFRVNTGVDAWTEVGIYETLDTALQVGDKWYRLWLEQRDKTEATYRARDQAEKAFIAAWETEEGSHDPD